MKPLVGVLLVGVLVFPGSGPVLAQADPSTDTGGPGPSATQGTPLVFCVEVDSLLSERTLTYLPMALNDAVADGEATISVVPWEDCAAVVQPEVTVDPEADAITAASPSPGEEPAVSDPGAAAGQATPYDAFLERMTGYVAKLFRIDRQVQSETVAPMKGMRQLTELTAGTVAWLKAHPPEACYAEEHAQATRGLGEVLGALRRFGKAARDGDLLALARAQEDLASVSERFGDAGDWVDADC